MSDLEAVKLREKYTHFRILVIGRANAGKTTLLKRVCNTDDDPCIYNENGENQVRGHHPSPSPWSRLLTRYAKPARTE
jgi:septin family protein